jgi:hypothetical protein
LRISTKPLFTLLYNEDTESTEELCPYFLYSLFCPYFLYSLFSVLSVLSVLNLSLEIGEEISVIDYSSRNIIISNIVEGFRV